MKINDLTLRGDEGAIFELRGLYESYGYRRYKMSKFEEYDLYLENKSFLPGGQVITFTDPRGKLLALKPDVTLSIAKNAVLSEEEPQKVYYNENVYRTPKGSDEFREIVQVGLEYIGQVDDYARFEVLSLAVKSLKAMSGSFVMAVSHLGFVSGLLSECGLPCGAQERVLSCLGHKNAHELSRVCDEFGVGEDKRGALESLTRLYGPFDETLEKAEGMAINQQMRSAVAELRELAPAMDGEFGGELQLDFSLISDLTYYNGLIFQGFIEGLPAAIVSGGQYDNLMEKLGRKTQAIGFAVYTDQLSELDREEERFDVDVLLLYDEGAEVQKLCSAVKMLTANGRSIRVQRTMPERLRYRQLLKLGEGGLEILGTND